MCLHWLLGLLRFPYGNKKTLTLNDRFWQPLLLVLASSKSTRECGRYEDIAHLKSGIARVIHSKDSGRAWIQNLCLYLSQVRSTVGNFFDALKSRRRLDFVAESSVTLAGETDRRVLDCGDDTFAAHRELRKFQRKNTIAKNSRALRSTP